MSLFQAYGTHQSNLPVNLPSRQADDWTLESELGFREKTQHTTHNNQLAYNQWLSKWKKKLEINILFLSSSIPTYGLEGRDRDGEGLRQGKEIPSFFSPVLELRIGLSGWKKRNCGPFLIMAQCSSHCFPNEHVENDSPCRSSFQYYAMNQRID